MDSEGGFSAVEFYNCTLNVKDRGNITQQIYRVNR